MITRALLSGILLLVPSAFAAKSNPTVVRDGTQVRVALPKDLLNDEQIRRELQSGLTTTFVVRAENGKRRGGGRIELRYELWDEVYLARTVNADGTEQRASLASRAALHEWWSTPRLLVLTGELSADLLQLRVDVLPFSASEEADAKRWLAQSATDAARASGDVRPGTSPLLDAVIGTSVRRKPVLSYVWRVRVRPATNSP